MGQRKHDDAHRPMGGRGQRGNRASKRANWGGAELIERAPCPRCGEWIPINQPAHSCSTAGVRVDAEARPKGMEPNYCNAEQCTCRMGLGYVACDHQPKWKPARGVPGNQEALPNV